MNTNAMMKKAILIFLALILSSCINQVDNATLNQSPTSQETIKINPLNPTMILTVESSPTLTNQEEYENIVQEYYSLANEFKILLINEGEAEINQLVPVITKYYDDYGMYPETSDQLIPDYLEEWPMILGIIDIQYGLWTDKTGYFLLFYGYPLGDNNKCSSFACWLDLGDEFVCEFIDVHECFTFD